MNEKRNPVRETLCQEILQVTGETQGGVIGSVRVGADEEEFSFAGGRFHIVYADPKGNKSIRRTGPKVAGYMAAVAGAVYYGHRYLDNLTPADLEERVADVDITVTGTIRMVDGKEFPMTWEHVLGFCIVGWTVGLLPTVLVGGRTFGHLIWMVEEAGRPFFDPALATMETITRSAQQHVIQAEPGDVPQLLGGDGKPVH